MENEVSKELLEKIKLYIDGKQEIKDENKDIKTNIPKNALGFSFKPTGKRVEDTSDLGPTLGEVIFKEMYPNFRDRLFSFIDKSGKKDSEIYNEAGVDRREFSKIRCDANYIPSKEKIICLSLVLKLSVDETNLLLDAGGWTLSHSIKRDMIIRYCIKNGIYNIQTIDNALKHFGYPTLWKYN